MASTSSQTPSSLASYSASTPTNWDVFLSFRGEDTRYSFTSHLYSALDRHGIRTFMDDPELRSGEVISDALLQAIKESKTYIVVLSENYASSSWCLDELVEILNSHKAMQKLVIPVFYHIDPSVVRYQTGSFEEDFRKHDIRFASQTERVKSWRFTLRQVADKSGEHICNIRSEADIINKIVEGILLAINPTTLDVANYPVGLESRVKGIKSLLSSGTIGVIKIGIYGMGGIGKTTLAKTLFNELLPGSFKGSCFLANVREISGTIKGLESLQQQLINDVLKSTTKVEVSSVYHGTKLIGARLCSKKILVVIDDLDDHKQFKSLVGPFASGSVVILTTRDEDILDKIEVETKYRYRLNELDDADSLALFCQHAFGDTKPDKTLMKLSKDILRHAGGLPLALEIFGSYLYKRSEDEWKCYIEKLQRIPNSSIQQSLKISLDALELDDPMLKKMFLDIACFFIGREKEQVVEIMGTYYSYADNNIDILKKRCLLTINHRDELRMHDLLQDLGKEIAHNNSHDEPGKHSRLWVSTEICDVLKKRKGTEAIESIMLDNFDDEDPFKEVSFAAETFRRMSKLRFLYLKGIILTGNFEQTLEDLRWFCWDHCPLKCLPNDFSPQKLVTLELPYSKMTTMWEVDMVSPLFKNLKTLNMPFSEDLTTTPDFTKLGCLESLNFSGCERLEEVHMSIGSLVRLVTLDLKGCVKLRSLPDTLCNLRALKSLNIGDCCGVEALPEELGNIKSLTKINARALNVLKVPNSIGCLSKLVKLKLDFNNKLETLPNSICSLRALEVLSIQYCTNLEALPVKLGNLESLRELNMRGLTVSKLPDSIGSLTKLVVLILSKNEKLETLPDTICNLRSLECLNIYKCKLRSLNAVINPQLKKIPDIGLSQIALSLEMLYLDWSGTALPSGLSQLSNLQELCLEECSNLFFIPKLPPNLKEINASECKSLERLPNLSNLKHLETLNLADCSGLTEIRGLEELTSLTNINLRNCSGLRDIEGLEGLASIKILECGAWDSPVAYNPLVAYNLTKRLFQIYSGFGREIKVCNMSTKFPDWISQSIQVGTPKSLNLQQNESDDSSAEEYSDGWSTAKLSLNLPLNVSHNYLGMVLCFKREGTNSINPDCSIKTSAGNYFRSVTQYVDSSCMVIVPRSIFRVTDEDTSMEIKLSGVDEVIVHLLLKPEVKMTDDYNNTTINELKFVDPSLQEFFLDIACFFIGWKNEEVVKILETCYTSVNHKIGILKERCLLTINDRDEFEMHHALQYMGRKIALNNSPSEPGNHSRLWLSIDIYDVLKKHKGTKAIEGIIPRKLKHQDALEGESFTTETFKRMSKLRFLYLKRVNLTGSFKQILEELRWLCWDECPLECLPSEFYPPELVILELPRSKLRTIWEPNMVLHVFDKLKTLNMSYSLALITTPDFTKLPCLETLNFEYCESLEEVHISIGSLVRLLSLKLHDCGKLKTLPHTICNLKSLEHLDIGGCSSLDALPTELGNIKSLTDLYAEELNVWKLPDSIGCLSKLVQLRLGCNKNLETFPNTICNLSSLEILDISRCEKLELLPGQLWKLTRLRELNVSGVTPLIVLPDIESSQIAFSLKKLNFSESSLTSLPSGISHLSALEVLDLKNCGHLLSVPELLPNMKCIYAYGCTSMKRLPNLCNLKQLEELYLTNCRGLTVILGLDELACIKVLHLEGCRSSLVAYTLTKRLFQIYFEFGHLIEIYAPKFPDWISRSVLPYLKWTTHIKLLPNVSRNLLGIVLCFKGEESGNRIDYCVENATTQFVCRGYFYMNDRESLMVMIPISIFPIRDGDEKIRLTSSALVSRGIHLLYKTKYDNTIVNIEDQRSNPLGSESKRKNWLSLGSSSTTVNVEEERSIPSKRLKRLDCNNWLSL